MQKERLKKILTLRRKVGTNQKLESSLTKIVMEVQIMSNKRILQIKFDFMKNFEDSFTCLS